MASANKTPNLNLPQWVGTEKQERTDFNAAFDAIDTTVASHLAGDVTQYINTTRDLEVAGSQVISELNFRPEALIIDVIVHNTKQVGFGKAYDTGAQYSISLNPASGNFVRSTTRGIRITLDGANTTEGTVTINSDNTITINWTKTGTGATGVANIFITALAHRAD